MRVLLVEDTAGLGEAVRDQIADDGHAVDWVQTLRFAEASIRTTAYDLILLDPPSFSNSKAMSDSFDVQRDHGDLVRKAMAVLRQEGRLYFSNNRRGFTLDDSLRDEFHCEDITPQTLPPDFQRNRKIHCCWSIGHI